MDIFLFSYLLVSADNGCESDNESQLMQPRSHPSSFLDLPACLQTRSFVKKIGDRKTHLVTKMSHTLSSVVHRDQTKFYNRHPKS